MNMASLVKEYFSEAEDVGREDINQGLICLQAYQWLFC